METGHTEGVVEKAVAYVKDMLGIPPGDKTPHGDKAPVAGDTAPEVTTDDAMWVEPHEYHMNSATELNAESARREDGE